MSVYVLFNYRIMAKTSSYGLLNDWKWEQLTVIARNGDDAVHELRKFAVRINKFVLEIATVTPIGVGVAFCPYKTPLRLLPKTIRDLIWQFSYENPNRSTGPVPEALAKIYRGE